MVLCLFDRHVIEKKNKLDTGIKAYWHKLIDNRIVLYELLKSIYSI